QEATPHESSFNDAVLSTNSSGDLATTKDPITLTLNVSLEGLGLIKPREWDPRLQRKAPGEIQLARGEVLVAKGRVDQAIKEYDNAVADVVRQRAIIGDQNEQNSETQGIINTKKGTVEGLSAGIIAAKATQLALRRASEFLGDTTEALIKGLPT